MTKTLVSWPAAADRADGKEAQIEIKREIAVPDREQPLGTSILLTIRPFLEEDCVRFSGNCRVKTEVVCKPERERDLQAVAFQTRKAILRAQRDLGKSYTSPSRALR